MLWKGENDSMGPSMLIGWSLKAPRDVTSIQWGDGPQINTWGKNRPGVSPRVVKMLNQIKSRVPLSIQRYPQSIWICWSGLSQPHRLLLRPLPFYLSSALISSLWSLCCGVPVQNKTTLWRPASFKLNSVHFFENVLGSYFFEAHFQVVLRLLLIIGKCFVD